MKVILKEDVKGLGKKEDMVNVSNGYARNFLLPRGIAVEVSPSNLNIMKARKEAAMTKSERDHARASEYAEKLAQKTVVIKSKAGGNLRLFGSVTGKDIADEIKKSFKIDIDKKKIVLEEPIRNIGEYDVEIKLVSGLTAKVNVKVEAEE